MMYWLCIDTAHNVVTIKYSAIDPMESEPERWTETYIYDNREDVYAAYEEVRAEMAEAV
jgi:hypothetical protein